MAKPRIFISSTYYDLRHIRDGIKSFIETLGYESVLFEHGDIPYNYADPLEESCYREINGCHILVLIIGGKYGSPTTESKSKIKIKDIPQEQISEYSSITKKEYETAIEKDIPVYIFVERNVLTEYYTYKENKETKEMKYAFVDNVAIFHLIDGIYSQLRNNPIKEFEKLDDITVWLKDQWAGRFAEMIKEHSDKETLQSMALQLDKLDSVTNALIEYSKKIIAKSYPGDQSIKIIDKVNKDMQENELANTLKANAYIRHVMLRHKGDFDKILNLIKTTTEAQKLYNLMRIDFGCTSLSNPGYQQCVNDALNLLSLKPLSFEDIVPYNRFTKKQTTTMPLSKRDTVLSKKPLKRVTVMPKNTVPKKRIMPPQ
jgi:hypothetical protein